MASKATKMGPEFWHCCGCGVFVEDCGGLLKTSGGWKCDDCIAWEHELESLDLEEWEEKRRQRLAEQQEY